MRAPDFPPIFPPNSFPIVAKNVGSAVTLHRLDTSEFHQPSRASWFFFLLIYLVDKARADKMAEIAKISATN